jgi:GT2 family glycosyltransferase
MVLYESDPRQVREAIRSCLSGSIKVQLTVVDNSPHQKLRPLVEKLGALYVPSARNLGFGAGHNVALRQSLRKSKYHVVLNPDIQFDTSVLPTLFDFMEENPDVGLVMPQVLYPNNDEQLLCKRLPEPIDLIVRRFGGMIGQKLFRERIERYMLRDVDLSVPRVVPSLSGCFMFIRVDVLRKVGIFDERFFMYMEDVDLCRRVGEVAQTVFFPDVSIYHGYQKGSYRDPHLLMHHTISALRYFGKWGWFSDLERQNRNQAVYSDNSIVVWDRVPVRERLRPSG